jgi:hypothetical protein
MRWLAAVALTTFALSPAISSERCEDFPKPVTSFGKYRTDGTQLGAQQHHDVAEQGVRYLRLHLQIADEAPDDWKVQITDTDGRPLQSFNRYVVQEKSFWTNRFALSDVRVSVSSKSGSEKSFVAIPDFVAMPSETAATYYSTKQKGVHDWKPLYPIRPDVHDYQRDHGQSVGMLVAAYNEGQVIGWTCSGFVIETNATTAFVTANHCGGPADIPSLIWHESVRSTMFVDFSWDGDGVSREYIVSGKPIVQDLRSDLAVLPIAPLTKDAPPPALELSTAEVSTPDARLPDELFVLHHPLGDQKQVSVCSPHDIIERNGIKTILHDCDVEGGSSGAPLLDKDGVVWGIHVDGYEKKPDGTCDGANKAVSSAELIRLLQGKPAAPR